MLVAWFKKPVSNCPEAMVAIMLPGLPAMGSTGDEAIKAFWILLRMSPPWFLRKSSN